jgi:hypothetical protein
VDSKRLFMALRPSEEMPKDDPVAYYSLPPPRVRHFSLELASEAL